MRVKEFILLHLWLPTGSLYKNLLISNFFSLQSGEFRPLSFGAKSIDYVKMSFPGFKMAKNQPQ
jgi:hypothetical protein